MTTLPPDTQVHWASETGAQEGPAPARDVVGWIQGGHLPRTTRIWWPEAEGWIPAPEVPGWGELLAPTATPAPPPAAAPQAGAPAPGQGGGHATDALMDGLTDQELDDEFIALVDRSWEMYKETEKADTIDEAIVGGLVTALVDSGFVLIDITTGLRHSLRFEVPTTGARVTVALQHLTPGLADAKVVGHRANLTVGYGERLGNAGQIGQALRTEVASSFVATPEPGTVSFDADISSGYVYASIDLYLEPERYVGDDLVVDHDLLRRHVAALVHTMRTFVHTRFGS
ncbi:hypothetical protein PO878_19095 [Iamia majanohamensis]|uniref:DUF4339 domain-containing protein n=1 Tax=Iamia majanohamensis TaxID=467976 RepID=A0AAF0BV14_9ACTN|nr:hypothetical protein [Iamia majanohamensis]WCO66608.1 hypothetical protein PO878_19095 [Iamia majanohamensis]